MSRPTRSSLRDLDLNLLVTLDAILAERSVTSAATRLGVTQSAVSHSLRRLREFLGDPLLVRSGSALVPTPRGLTLQPALTRILGDIDQLVAGTAAFQPRTATDRFVLAATDYGGLVILPHLMRLLRREAPSVSIDVRSLGSSLFDAMASGEIGLALGHFTHAPGAFRMQTLVRERFVCLVRKDHPTVTRSLTLDEFVVLDHILIAPAGSAGGVVDDALAALDRRRSIALRVPHFLAAPFVVAETDLVLTIAEKVARKLCRVLPLRMVAPPLPLGEFAVAQLWHERVHDDPAHAWLRRGIARAAGTPGQARAAATPDVATGSRPADA